MNKTLLLLIAGIVVVGGMVGYTVLNKSPEAAQTVESVPHDDSGTSPHID